MSTLILPRVRIGHRDTRLINSDEVDRLRVGLLIKQLNAHNYNLRWYAADTIGGIAAGGSDIDVSSTIVPLNERLKKEKNDSVRQTILYTLLTIQSKVKLDEVIISDLEEHLEIEPCDQARATIKEIIKRSKEST